MVENKSVPLVGQFSGPSDNSPRTPAELPRKSVITSGEPPTVPRPSEGDPGEQNERQDNRPKTPQEKAADYQQGLIAVGVSPVVARGILEKVLVESYYEETCKLGPLQVSVRTRSYNDVMRTLRFLELEKPTYSMGINDVVARYNMAASLVSYGDQKFRFPTKKGGATEDMIEEAFHERLSFILDLPVVAMNRLMQIVHDFDEKISAVFAEGGPEDF